MVIYEFIGFIVMIALILLGVVWVRNNVSLNQKDDE